MVRCMAFSKQQQQEHREKCNVYAEIHIFLRKSNGSIAFSGLLFHNKKKAAQNEVTTIYHCRYISAI